jgi:hypothetical protein
MGDHHEQALVPLRLETIRIGFIQLGDRVNAALRTQVGDRLRLSEQNSGVLRMLQATQEVLNDLSLYAYWLKRCSIRTSFQQLSVKSWRPALTP